MEELKLRKIFILALLTIFLLPTVNPAAAQSYGPSVIEKESIEDFKDYTFEDILSLKPFVHVEDGFFVLNENGASEAGIDSILIKYNKSILFFKSAG